MRDRLFTIAEATEIFLSSKSMFHVNKKGMEIKIAETKNTEQKTRAREAALTKFTVCCSVPSSRK